MGNGTYTYDTQFVEFTKEYFEYDCQYKVYGQIERSVHGQLEFRGFWKLMDSSNGSRGGNVRMHYVERTQCRGVSSSRIEPGTYRFYGHCDYLPNAEVTAERRTLF